MHGQGAARWHGQRAEHAHTKTLMLGASAAGLAHPKTRALAQEFAKSQNVHVSNEHAKTVAAVAGGAAALTGAYGMYHEKKRMDYEKAYYTRKQNGKNVRVKKGRRKNGR